MISSKSPLFLLGLLPLVFAIASVWWTIEPTSGPTCLTGSAPFIGKGSTTPVAHTPGGTSPLDQGLCFEENRGQFDKRVKFLSRAPGHRVFLGAGEAVLVFGSQSGDRGSGSEWIVRLILEGANNQAMTVGMERLPGRSHYFRGRATDSWHENVSSFRKVRYEDVYPNIDLIYYYRDRQLEFDFLLQPGADARAIRLRLDGAEVRSIDGDGRLLIQNGEQRMFLDRPRVYQSDPGGTKREIKARYSVISADTVGFEVEGHNPDMALLIDPAFVYSTYFGGSGSDECQDMQVDAAGNAYVVGYTESTNFPTTSGVIQSTKKPAASNFAKDAFVFKMNSAGQPVFSTYLGGTGDDFGYGIAVDGQGNVFISGRTRSDDFPTTAGAYRTSRTGSSDIFVAKLNSAGSALTYSTFLGGSDSSATPRIAVDPSGNAYVAGETSSAAFPVVNAYQSTLKGSSDAFLVKLNSSGGAAVFSTYLGGGSSEVVGSVAADRAGYAWVVGYTQSTDFPVKSAIQASSEAAVEMRSSPSSRLTVRLPFRLTWADETRISPRTSHSTGSGTRT